MSKAILIEKTLNTLSKLSQEKVREISDFADYILKKYDEDILREGMKKLLEDSKAFEFLVNEEELYSLEDLKEKY